MWIRFRYFFVLVFIFLYQSGFAFNPLHWRRNPLWQNALATKRSVSICKTMYSKHNILGLAGIRVSSLGPGYNIPTKRAGAGYLIFENVTFSRNIIGRERHIIELTWNKLMSKIQDLELQCVNYRELSILTTWQQYFMEKVDSINYWQSCLLNMFPNPINLDIKMQRLLLDIFIQLGVGVVDTVPAGTGIIKVLLQGWLSPRSLHTRLHPVVAGGNGSGLGGS